MDFLAAALPLPFRVYLLFVLGPIVWAIVLAYTKASAINALELVGYTATSASGSLAGDFTPALLAIACAVASLPALGTFWACTGFNPELAPGCSAVPNSFVAVLLSAAGMLVLWHPGVRWSFYTLLRASVGFVSQSPKKKFGDTLMADALVSYTKVLADLAIVVCMVFRSTSTTAPDRRCAGWALMPALATWPPVARMVQCGFEYSRNRRRPVPLWNMLKYASSIPVIWLGAIANLSASHDAHNHAHQEPTIIPAWVFCAVINILFSVFWDVTMDWDFNLFGDTFRAVLARTAWFHVQPAPSTRPFGLRQQLCLWTPGWYYVAIAIDVALRFGWTYSFFPDADPFYKAEVGAFALQLAEIGRRALWLVLRIETQHVREHSMPVEGYELSTMV